MDIADKLEVDVVVAAPGRADVRVPIWIVGVDGNLYTRSWKGEGGVWYRRAREHGAGTIVAGGAEHPVRFVAVTDPELDARIDEAYLTKYRHSPYAQAMVGPPAAGTTMQLLERAG